MLQNYKKIVIMLVIPMIFTIGIPFSAFAGSDFSWTQFAGSTIRVLLNRHPWQKAIEPYIPEFEKLTGMKVICEVYPEDQFRAKRLVEVASGVATIDAFMLMPQQAGLKYVRAGWLIPLEKFLEDPALTSPDYDFDDLMPAARKAEYIEEKLIGIPIQIENGCLMYRKDLFAKYGVTFPRNFEELEQVAKKLTLDIDGDEKTDIYGIVMRGKRAAATSQWSSWLFSMGGEWLDAKRNPVINSPAAVKAFEVYGKLLRSYGPPGVLGYHWYECTQLFQAGKAAMHLGPNCFYSIYEDPEKSKVVGKTGYGLFPAGPGGHVPYVGIWGLSVPYLSKKPEAAWLFVQWATSKEMVTKTQLERVLGARESVWADPVMEKTFPSDIITNIAQSLKLGTPQWNPPVLAVAEIRDVVGSVIVDAIQGKDVKASADKAVKEIKKIMEATE